MFELDFALPLTFLLLTTAGLVYGVVATYFFLRFERSVPDKDVLVAITSLIIYFVLQFAIRCMRGYVFVPMLYLFLMVMALLVSVWLGIRAHSKAGNRIALAAALTLGAFVLEMVYIVHSYPLRF